ncbi:hypothetical protein Tco_0019945 [Tanacetum coccineum]
MYIIWKNMANYKHSQLKNKSFEEIQMLFDNTMKWVDSFIPMDSEVVEGSKSHAEGSKKRTREELEFDNSKKRKIDENVEAEVDDEAEMKKHMEIVHDDEVAIDAIPLTTTPQSFLTSQINLVREDLETLLKLVKAKHEHIRPEEAYERDHNLWDIIVNGDLQEESVPSGDQSGPSLSCSKNFIITGCQKQIDQDDLEELNIRWQVAMMTVRVQRFIQKTGRNLDFKGIQHVTFDKRNTTTNEPSSQALVAQDGLGGYDWSNDFDEPVNYDLMAISSSSSSSSSENEGYELALESLESRILGHEKNELAWGEKYEFQNYELKCRELKINNLNMELEKVVKERDKLNIKIAKWEESSKSLNILLNSQMSAHDKNGLGYGTQMNEKSDKSETDSEISMSVFEVRSSDEESTPTNDSFSKADGYHVVPPPITRNFLTPRVDISFAGNTNEVNVKKPKSVNESVVSTPNINKDKVIIEDWNSDDEDDLSEVSPVKTNETQTAKTQFDKISQTSKKVGIGFKKIKACFVCKSTDHLIKDCDFYHKKSPELKLKNVVNTGVLTRTGLVNPVRPNEKRAVQTINTARPVSTARSVSIARPFAPKIAHTSSAVRPIYPRMDNVRPRASYS